MKQQITPVIAAAVVLVVAVIGIAIYFFSSRSPAPRPQTPEDKAVRGLSPDQQVKMRMQQGRTGGQ